MDIHAAVLAAAAGGRVDELTRLLESDATLMTAADAEGHNVLYTAARDGHVACVELLLARGADKDAKNNHGTTPLLGAASEGHENCVEALLRAGADKEAKSNDGNTPLLRAAYNGHEKCVEALLRAGAAVDSPDMRGSTPLQVALKGSHHACAHLLLARGCTVNGIAADVLAKIAVAALRAEHNAAAAARTEHERQLQHAESELATLRARLSDCVERDPVRQLPWQVVLDARETVPGMRRFCVVMTCVTH